MFGRPKVQPLASVVSSTQSVEPVTQSSAAARVRESRTHELFGADATFGQPALLSSSGGFHSGPITMRTSLTRQVLSGDRVAYTDATGKTSA